MFFSDYTINSLYRAVYFGMQDVYITDIIEYYMDTKGKPLITTGLLGKAFPQIEWKYGPNEPVSIRERVNSESGLPTFKFSSKGFEVTARDFEIGFIIQKEEALTFIFDSYNVTGNLFNQDYLIKGEIQNPIIKGLKVKHTTLTDVSPEVLVSELLNKIKENVSSLNEMLKKGFSIPHLTDKTGSCLDFNDNSIVFDQDFVQGELNIRKCNQTMTIESDNVPFFAHNYVYKTEAEAPVYIVATE